MKKRLFRTLALILALLTLSCSLFACGAKDPASLSAKEVIGTVDGVKVTYDELYFLIKTYEDAYAEKYEGKPEELAAALEDLVYEEIVANPAIRLLCEKHGLSYSESKLADDVTDEINAILQNDFGGDKAAYLASLEENGLTEHYLRYTTGLDILYDELTSVYPEKGLVISSTPELRAYILNNFICTYHIALFNDTPEEDAENAKMMAEAHQMLTSGKATMYQLISGSKRVGQDKISLKGYNEDVSDLQANGHYLTEGSWDEDYEEVAFSLEIGEFSEVIRATGESPKTGRTVPTYYIIQRVALDEDYITKNLSTLQDEYYASVIYSDLRDLREDLTFEPNDLYESLDLTALHPPVEKDYTVLIIVLGTLGGALLVGTIVLIVLRKKKKKKQAKA